MDIHLALSIKNLPAEHTRMNSDILNAVTAHIRAAYGSTAEPDFSFVQIAVRERPHQELIEKLQQDFRVQEDTDPNDDVSFGYLLAADSGSWLLRLSMVGPLAALFRLDEGLNVAQVLTPARPDLHGMERRILTLVAESGFSTLGQDILEQPVSLKLFNTDPDDVRVYQALFSDVEVLPWERRSKEAL